MNDAPKTLSAIVVLAVTGFCVATYVFVTHAIGYTLFCPFATGCDVVQASPYALLFGVPASALGMLGFTTYIALAVISLRSGRLARGCLHALLLLSAVEVGFTAYMAYLQVAVIRAICSWCMLSAALTVALAVLVLSAVLGREGGKRAGLDERPVWTEFPSGF